MTDLKSAELWLRDVRDGISTVLSELDRLRKQNVQMVQEMQALKDERARQPDKPLAAPKHLLRSVDDLKLSPGAVRTLDAHGMDLIGQLVLHTGSGFHAVVRKEVNGALAKLGLCMGMRIDGWPALLGKLHSKQGRRAERKRRAEPRS